MVMKTNKVKKSFSLLYLALVLLFLYAPLAVLFVFSFTESSAFGVWKGFSIQPYIDIFASKYTPKIAEAVFNTLVLALVSSLIATVLGTLAAIGIYNMKSRMRKILSNVNQLPIINAEIVTAVGLMILFASLFHIKSGWLTLIIGHVSFCTPYVVLSVMPRLYQMDGNIYEAALDLGASPTRALLKVLIPTVKPGILAGFLLAFTISLDDFVITIFNNGSVQTLSTYIWSDSKRGGLEPTTKALSVLLFIIVLVILIIVNFRKSKNKKENAE